MIRGDLHDETMKEDIEQALVSDVASEMPTVRRRTSPRRAVNVKSKQKAAKPEHYKVICISIYTNDLEQLDAKVAELKRRGFTKLNKSRLIRIALQQLTLDNAVAEAGRDERAFTR